MHRIGILGVLRMAWIGRLGDLGMLGQVLRVVVLTIGGAVGRIHHGIRMMVGLKYRPWCSRVVVVYKGQALRNLLFSEDEMEIYLRSEFDPLT